MEIKKCPKCKSSKVKLVDYLGINCVVCSNCGYDESKQYNNYPGGKNSQKAKGSYTPYKSGGYGRARGK